MPYGLRNLSHLCWGLPEGFLKSPHFSDGTKLSRNKAHKANAVAESSSCSGVEKKGKTMEFCRKLFSPIKKLQPRTVTLTHWKKCIFLHYWNHPESKGSLEDRELAARYAPWENWKFAQRTFIHQGQWMFSLNLHVKVPCAERKKAIGTLKNESHPQPEFVGRIQI